MKDHYSGHCSRAEENEIRPKKHGEIFSVHRLKDSIWYQFFPNWFPSKEFQQPLYRH